MALLQVEQLPMALLQVSWLLLGVELLVGAAPRP